MPKIKTNKAASKRFRRNAKGKFLRGQANKSHNTAKRSAKRRRQLRGSKVVDATNAFALTRLLPYI
jgi:large subunit ribosomal protein L35